MTGFCVETLQLDPQLRAQDGVLRASAVAVTSDARIAAERILERARAEADALVQKAQGEARQVVEEAEKNTLQRANTLLQMLEDANASVPARSQDIVISLVQSMFDRLVAEMTPQERIAAMLKRVLSEAPSKPASPMLRLHPDDVKLLPEVEWEIKADASLPSGTCLLETAVGEWRADFSAAVSALKSALTRATQDSAAAPDEQ